MYFALNYWSVTLLARTNGAITVFKIIIPILTAVALLDAGFHPGNFTNPTLGGFAPYGWSSVLTAISTSGIITGVVCMASSSHMIYAMERNKTMPAILGRIHPQSGIPRVSMWFNLGVAFIFLFFFRGWGALAAVISVMTVISFLTGPICVAALRRVAPDMHRPLRVKGLSWIAPVAFVCASEVLYWSCWPLTGEIIVLMVAALPVYCYYQHRAGWPNFARELNGAWLLSMLGSSAFGGMNVIPYGWDLTLVAVVSLEFYHWGVRSGWCTPYLNERHAERRAFAAADDEVCDTTGIDNPLPCRHNSIVLLSSSQTTI